MEHCQIILVGSELFFFSFCKWDAVKFRTRLWKGSVTCSAALWRTTLPEPAFSNKFHVSRTCKETPLSFAFLRAATGIFPFVMSRRVPTRLPAWWLQVSHCSGNHSQLTTSQPRLAAQYWLKTSLFLCTSPHVEVTVSRFIRGPVVWFVTTHPLMLVV